MNAKQGIISSSALLGLGLLASNVTHALPDVAVGVKAGTVGYGAEVTAPLTEKRLRLRVGATTGNLHRSTTDQNINYDANLKFNTASALVDFHPFAGAFRLSAGAYYNKNKFSLTGNSQDGAYTINGDQYTAQQVGTLTGGLTFNKTAPYVGLGFGNAVGKGSRLSFTTDLGILFQGSPHATLTASNLQNNAQLASDVEAAREHMESSFKNFKYYPVLNVGLAFKF